MDSKLLPEDRIISFKRLGSHNEWYPAKVIEWSREGLLLKMQIQENFGHFCPGI